VELVYPPVIALARGWFAVQGLNFTIKGAANVPAVGGALMVINHVGFCDFLYAGMAARTSRRLVRFMAKEDVFTHKVSGPLMRGMHHIPVDREAGSSSFREALSALRDGEIVGIFPEATISRSFELKEFKPGAVRLAQAAGVPLLPTVVWGSQRIWTKAHKKRLGRTQVPIHVYVGAPITVAKGAAAAEAATTQLLDRMTELLHSAQAAYEDAPADSADSWWLPARLGGSAPTPEEAERLDEEERAARAARRTG
jgi:1-acyl-sn-glycerol-3-phosphate acyltransferase